MTEERYKRLFGKICPSEELLLATVAAAQRPRASRHWRIAAACAAVLIVAAVCCITLPPRDVVASNGEAAANDDEFLPIETAAGYGCCDVRDLTLNIVRGSIQRGLLFVEVELVGEGLHPDMVVTLRLQEGNTCLTAFHLLYTEVKQNAMGVKMVSHLMSCRMDAAAIPPEGRRLTLAVNNYDCGLDHARYPHFAEDEAWNVVLPDCNTLDFKVFSDGTISVMPE